MVSLYLIGFTVRSHISNEFGFMSRTHTNICRAISAGFVVFQHVAGGFGVRYLTPLGGIGVAIFNSFREWS